MSTQPGHLPRMAVTLDTSRVSVKEAIAYAVEAERLGYRAFLPTETSSKEAFSLLALVAQATTAIELGTAIISVYTRTPTLIAMAAAMLDGLSGGRLVLGLGTGGPGFVTRGHGIPIARPLARVREYVTIVRDLLRGERVSYGGEFFQIQDFRLREKPVRRNLPLYISALNPRMLSLGGECADGVILNLMPLAFAGEARARIAEGAHRAGRDPDTITLATLLLTCVDSRDEAALKALKRLVAFYMTSPAYHYLLTRAGYGDIVRETAAAWNAGEHAQAVESIPSDFLEQVSLVGDREVMRQRIGAYLREGIYPIIYPAPRDSRVFDDMIAAIQAVAGAAP